MNKQTRNSLSAIFSKYWLEKNSKTVELEAEECLSTNRYIGLANSIVGLSSSLIVVLIAVMASPQKTFSDVTLFSTGLILFTFFFTAGKIKNHFKSKIGGAGVKLANEWKAALKEIKGVSLEFKNKDFLSVHELTDHIVEILAELGKEVQRLEQLEMPDERQIEREKMKRIISLFNGQFGTNIGPVKNHFPQDFSDPDQKPAITEITLTRILDDED